MFVSRKDGKLYVRQNFTPLFDVPVTIAPSDRPLGTHVFTAEADKDDANLLRWSVVSLPVAGAQRRRSNDEDERASRRRKIAGVRPPKQSRCRCRTAPPRRWTASPFPPDAMARIAEALSTGGSIVVSDQGINQAAKPAKARISSFRCARCGSAGRFAPAAGLEHRPACSEVSAPRHPTTATPRRRTPSTG